MKILRLIWIVLACMAAVPVWACSPPLRRDVAGFERHDVGTLPRNARGVMFIPVSGKPASRDFVLKSDRDASPMAVRIRSMGGTAVRVEPVHGFQAGARYTFRYVVPHGNWFYPDTMTVAIDARTVDTGGKYALVLAPRPVRRVVVIPGSSACVEPIPAVVQEFTHTVPAALLPYAASLAYDVQVTGSAGRPGPVPRWGLAEPAVYSALVQLSGMENPVYDTYEDALIAQCGRRMPPIVLRGRVRFPEVDDRDHVTPSRTVELARAATVCDELDALLQTVAQRPFEQALRAVCGSQIAGFSVTGKQSLSALTPGDWAFQLEFFVDTMSPTCNLVGLAYVMHTGQFSTTPAALNSLATALRQGLPIAGPEQRDAALHALSYLVEQLPPATRAATARHLLAPSQALLVKALGEQKPVRPDEITRLIRRSGPLQQGARGRVETIAAGSTGAATHARALLLEADHAR